ncbi:restriction endonuclease subunit S [Proteus mirabilis]|uniref:restriction endonuclease subunit S n=1 Tax=Morganellaceae TaxID=1903414 RepID=UPI001373DF6A|nr:MULTISPECIES: restriction endonuclease subunit S [Morganellaceae]EKU2833495.1 restriction endonuclease subunit S [Proteus mirabilis]MCL8603370.1 restriction endonuclease subunit S [Proteus mirabilis]MCT0100705.1 restriction endonuclease subunit S [Proteus mirabilis]MCT8226062.1 restriction endonuclease subunit S [Proteus mirabilis]QKG42135.1 restriction endonuclease subunit S [Proteus mirabilis]
MSEWVEYSLEDVAEITSSKRIFYADYVDYGIPFYRSKEIIELYNRSEISNSLYISEQKYLEIKEKYGVPVIGDILLTSVGTLGIPYLVNNSNEFYFKDGNLTWIRKINKNIVLPDFIYCLLNSPLGKNKLDEITIGSTQAALTIAGLKKIKISVPNLSEQLEIVHVIQSISKKIELLHRQNKTLESMAETLFRQWFADDSNGSGKEVELHEIIEFNPKRVLPKGSKAMYLEMAGLNTNTFAASGYYERDFTSGQKFIKQDTLLARITPCLENGKAGYVHFLSPEQVGWGSTEFIVLRPKPKFHPLFSYILCRNNEFKEYAESCMEGSSGRQRVNVSHLSMYTLTLPHDDVITQFNEILASIEPKLISNALQIQTLENLRDTLLPKLMSGEVRVNYTPEEIKQ